jgi:hypothetical protein
MAARGGLSRPCRRATAGRGFAGGRGGKRLSSVRTRRTGGDTMTRTPGAIGNGGGAGPVGAARHGAGARPAAALARIGRLDRGGSGRLGHRACARGPDPHGRGGPTNGRAVTFFSLSAPQVVRLRRGERAGRRSGDRAIRCRGRMVMTDDDSGGGLSSRAETELAAGAYCLARARLRRQPPDRRHPRRPAGARGPDRGAARRVHRSRWRGWARFRRHPALPAHDRGQRPDAGRHRRGAGAGRGAGHQHRHRHALSTASPSISRRVCRSGRSTRRPTPISTSSTARRADRRE